jgi:Leucine-rich repeat (LRR) protein
LDVSHNLITTVPRGIGYCAGLAAFNLEGNHIFSPPPMILKMGTSAVIVYLRQLCDADKNEKVDLHGLDLPLLPQELSELSLVKDVDISNNFLTSIRPLQVLTQLTSLNPKP